MIEARSFEWTGLDASAENHNGIGVRRRVGDDPSIGKAGEQRGDNSKRLTHDAARAFGCEAEQVDGCRVQVEGRRTADDQIGISYVGWREGVVSIQAVSLLDVIRQIFAAQ